MNPDFRPYGTWLLLLACILIYLRFDLSQSADAYDSNFFAAGISTPALVASGQFWRIFTANFVHFGFFHILMNGVGIYFLGPRLEFELGIKRYLTLFLVSGTVGLSFALLFMPPSGALAGASAGLFGMLGAYMALGIRHGLGAMNYFQSPSGRAMGSILLINLVFGLVIRNISLTGHIGGFLVGLALCLFSFRIGKLPVRPASAVATGLAFFCCVLWVLHPVHRTWFLGRHYWFAEGSRAASDLEALKLQIPDEDRGRLTLLQEFKESQRTGQAAFHIPGGQRTAEKVLLHYWGIPLTRAEDMAEARETRNPAGIPTDPWKP